ncbi:hypothetical protein [Pedobacter sp. JCM 36344]|uniref:hypothetical protein n=1 Tax=Pedobacter sp. JCM 36344 TaxID=3374280 RepID=UPI00397BE740
MKDIESLKNDLSAKVANVTVASKTLKTSGYIQEWPLENYISCLEEALDSARTLLGNQQKKC